MNQQSPLAEGTVVITNNQTAGRGQRGSTWITDAGLNLTFSTILKPSFLAVHQQHLITMVSSLAVRDYVASATGRQVHIKWPNDIIIEDKKVCGILIENQIQSGKISSSVVGIGLNVNQKDFPVETATSVAQVMSDEIPLGEALEKVLEFLEARYLQLKQSRFENLKQDYLKNMLWRNESHYFQASDKKFEGMILGLDDTGRLLMETGAGKRSFDIKEISYLY